MYESLGSVTLRTGETVEAGVVKGPDHDWAARLEKLLWHKGEPWNWQNAQCLARDLGVGVFFHILHRAGTPLANIMTVEHNGVGHFGHVWTEPTDRQKGASKGLMALQMAHFQQRGGQALFLGTGYDSVAYHIYRSYGFQSIEDQNGYMTYYATSLAAFTDHYYAPLTDGRKPILARFGWQDWVTSAPLLLGNFRGMIRCAPWGVVGRQSSEGYLLPALLKEEQLAERNSPPRTLVLRHPDTEAVVGLAAWKDHPIWPDTCLVDLYCHPAFWGHAEHLWNALELPQTERVIAYVDSSDRNKVDLLMAKTFHPVATLPGFVARDTTGNTLLDVTVLQRNGSVG